jgi:hypothetical protein
MERAFPIEESISNRTEQILRFQTAANKNLFILSKCFVDCLRISSNVNRSSGFNFPQTAHRHLNKNIIVLEVTSVRKTAGMIQNEFNI